MATNNNLPPKTKSLVENVSSEAEIRSKQINSLSKQISISNQKTKAKQQDLSNKISSLTKLEKQQRKNIEKINNNPSKNMSSVVPEVDNILTQLGYTIQNLAKGVQKITVSTANASKEAVSQYGRAISEDISINRQNTIAMGLAQATPLFGYFAAKFMETDVFKKTSQKIKDQLGSAVKYVGVNLKNAVTGITKSMGQKIGDFFSKKQKLELSQASKAAMGNIKAGTKDTARNIGSIKKSKAKKIPKMARGGYVEKEGIVKLHKAEVVMPIEQVLKKMDDQIGTSKLAGKITNNLTVLSRGMANMETYVQTDRKKSKGIIKDFISAFKEAKNTETMKWHERMLKALLELKLGLIGMTSRMRIAWQRTLVEHPVFRNLLMIGDVFKTAFTSPLKFLFGLKGGYKGEVAKATKTNNVFLKMSNLLGLLYSGSMIRLDNIAKYSKELLEFNTGKEASVLKDKTWTVFDKIKDFMEGKRDDKSIKEKLYDSLIEKLDLSKDSINRARGIKKEEVSNLAKEVTDNIKSKVTDPIIKTAKSAKDSTINKSKDIKDNVKERYRSVKEKLGGIGGKKVPGFSMGSMMRETKEVIAHRGEMILPVRQVVEMIKTFSSTVYKLVKAFKPIEILKNILIDIKNVVKKVGSQLIDVSKKVGAYGVEKGRQGIKALKKLHPWERTKEIGRRSKKYVTEDIPEKVKKGFRSEVQKAKEAQKLEKNKMPHEFNRPDYVKGTKSGDASFTFFERIRQKAYNRFLKKQQRKEDKFTKWQEKKELKFQSKYDDRFKDMTGRYDKHIKKTEKSHAGWWDKFSKTKESREEKFKQHDAKMNEFKNKLDVNRNKKLSRFREFAAFKVARAQSIIFKKTQKDQLNTQNKYNKKILSYQNKQNKKTLKYTNRIDKQHKGVLARIFKRQEKAEDKHLKKMTKIEKIQDRIEKKKEKALKKVSAIREKIEKRRTKFENKLAIAKAKVERKEANRVAKVQGKLKLLKEKRAAKAKMKLDKLKFKLEAPERKRKEREAKKEMKQRLVDMKKELKDAKAQAKIDKKNMKESVKKAKKEAWAERKGLIAQRWKQLTSFPKKIDEFRKDSKKAHKEDYKNAREQIEKLSKISKYSMKIGDGLKKLGSRIKKMGSGIFKWIMMGISALSTLIGPMISSVISFLPAMAMGIGSLASGLLGKGIGLAGKGIGALGSGKLLKGAGIVAGVGGLLMGGEDAAAGVEKARDWHGVKKGEKVKTSQKVTSGIGGFLGGTEEQFTMKGAMHGVAKGAMLGAGIGSIVPGIGTIIGGAVGAIAGGILGFVGGENISKGLQFVWDKLKGLVEGVWKLIKLPITFMVDLAKRSWDWLKEQGKEKWENFKTSLSEIVEFWSKPFNYVKDLVVKAGVWIKDRLIKQWGPILNPIITFYAKPFNYVVGLVKKGWDWLKEQGKEKWENFKTSLSEIVEFWEKPFNHIKGLVKKGKDWIKNKAKETWTNVLGVLSSAWESVKKPFSFIGDLIKKAGSFIADQIEKIPGIGRLMKWIRGKPSKDKSPASVDVEKLRENEPAISATLASVKQDAESKRTKNVYENQQVPDEFGQPIVPVKSGLITSKYGPRNTGLRGASKMHRGIDMRAPMGEPVRAMWGGKVTEAGGPWGIVGVKHSKDYTSKYVHLSGIGAEVGDSVHAGDVIGKAGKTGPIPGMASHLHLGLKRKGKYVDPNETFKTHGIKLAMKGSKREVGDAMESPTGSSINMKQLAQNGVESSMGESKYAAGLFSNATGKLADKISDGAKQTTAAIVYSTNVIASTNANMSNSSNNSGGGGGGGKGPQSFSSGDSFVKDILQCNIS